MAIENMTKVGILGEKNELAWEYTKSLAAVATGDPVIVPDGVNQLAITLVPGGGGKGKVQASTDLLNTVINDQANITWVDWDLGEITAVAQDSCVPPTAIRLNQTFAGTLKMVVRAQ